MKGVIGDKCMKIPKIKYKETAEYVRSLIKVDSFKRPVVKPIVKPIRLCKDCKWSGRDWFLSQHLQTCKNPEIVIDDLRKYPGEDGKPFANVVRQYGPCFNEGIYWERR